MDLRVPNPAAHQGHQGIFTHRGLPTSGASGQGLGTALLRPPVLLIHSLVWTVLGRSLQAQAAPEVPGQRFYETPLFSMLSLGTVACSSSSELRQNCLHPGRGSVDCHSSMQLCTAHTPAAAARLSHEARELEATACTLTGHGPGRDGLRLPTSTLCGSA